MPRVNIEEKWWSDPRRMLLSDMLGFGAGDGAFFNAVRVSQNFNGEPFDATKLLPIKWIEALLSVGLATGMATAMYVCGAKEHHEWIKLQRERASKGGKALSNKNKHLKEADAKPRLSHGQANAMPSSSSSSSNTSVAVATGRKPTANAVSAASQQDRFVSRIQKYFLQKWEEKYGTPYKAFAWAQSGALLKKLEREFGESPEQIERAVDTFLACDEDFIDQSRHAFSVMFKTINRWLVDKSKDNGWASFDADMKKKGYK